jgi:hypothetical protein
MFARLQRAEAADPYACGRSQRIWLAIGHGVQTSPKHRSGSRQHGPFGEYGYDSEEYTLDSLNKRSQ